MPLVEFAYDDSYHSSIGMAPYEALYGKKCKFPLCWAEAGKREPLRSDLILETTEEVRLIQQRIQATYSRQKSYANPKCKHLEFAVGDHAFFKVSPMKGVMRFSRKGKLSLRYIGPFEIIGRVEAVAYELALPPKFASVHPVFHISLLRKYILDP